MSQKLNYALDNLTMKEIITATGDDRLNRAEKRKRSGLVASVQHLPDAHISILFAADNKAPHIEDPYFHTRKSELEVLCWNLTHALQFFNLQCYQQQRWRPYIDKMMKKNVCLQREQPISSKSLFLEEVGDSVRNECLTRFIDRTGNASCRLTISVVCTGEFFASETTELALHWIQHKDVLQPYVPHHSQRLVNGMHAAVTMQDNNLHGFWQSNYRCGTLGPNRSLKPNLTRAGTDHSAQRHLAFNIQFLLRASHHTSFPGRHADHIRMKPTAPPIKRGRGRPRGSKNQPGAGHVGRPRNDGQPPRKRHNGHDHAESTTPVPNTSHSAMQTPRNDEVQHCGKEYTPTPRRALAIDVDLDSEVFENLDPPARVHTIPPALPIAPRSAACSEVPLKQTTLAFRTAMEGANPVLEAPTASAVMRTPHISPISTDAREQQSEPAASISPQTSTHQPRDFSESGPATTIHEADPPAESVATSSGMPQRQPWRHDANAPALPPSPKRLSRRVRRVLLTVFPENPYGSDLEAPAPRDDTESDRDEEASLEDEFRPVPDDGGEDEDTEHGRGTSTFGSVGRSSSRSTMPLWLSESYKVVETMLKKEIKQSTRTPAMPKCYEQQRLWVGDASPFLTLLTQPSIAVEPSIFHQPAFFVWLPHCLLGDRIPCPQCKASNELTKQGKPVFLQRLGWIGKPRRAVDVARNVYIIGYRYSCVHPGCRKTYRSWSSAILNVLPAPVAMQFPFQLTYRSVLSNSLVLLLHSSIRAGIGPVPFMQMLQSFHYENFDNLRLQYLELVHDRYKSCPKQLWVRKQAFGSLGDRNGYAGFVPSAGYLRRFYDTIIERRSTEMKQCIAMLPARVLAIDHSFKVPSFIIHELLAKFGHPEVQSVSTDNVRADKNELERVFPSLLKDVVPVLPHSSLPLLEFPHGSWTIVELSNTHQVNHRFDVIMNHRTMTNPNVTVAFDMQWPVNLETGIHGPVALIQATYQNTVYLIKLELASSGCRAMAKERGATVKRAVGLAELVGIPLGRHLPKDPQARVSPRWADAVLPQEYINYTVLDVYAVSQVHLQLAGMDIAQPVVATTPSGTAIALLAPDGQAVAHGIVALERPPALNGVDVSPKRVVMTVSKVLVPSFLLPARLQKAKQAKSLASFSSTPFSIVADIRNLRICPSTHDEGSDGPSSGSCMETLGDHQVPKSGVLDTGYIDSSSTLTSTLVLNEDECDGDSETSPEQTIEGSLRDPAAEAALVGVMEPYIARHHGLRQPFARALSAAFFIPVAEDKSAMEAVLKGFGTTYNAQLLSKPDVMYLHLKFSCPVLRSLSQYDVPASSNFRCGWVNGNDYELAHETFGMIQFLPVFFKPLGMLEFNEVFAREQNIRHKFIAESQGTLMAILPVHTRDLFQLLVQSSPLFSDSNRQPNWSALAVVCAGHADGRNIFYKLPEHLKTYYKTWTDFCNEQNTISLNAEASRRIRALIRSASTNVTIKAPTALPTTLRDSLAASTCVDINEVNPRQIGKLLADHALQRSAVHYLYGDTMHVHPSVAGSLRERKRKADNHPTTTGSSEGVNRPGKRTNKPRKCRNCQSTQCAGRWAVKKCTLPLEPLCFVTSLHKLFHVDSFWT
ncbi:hypothetical protein DFJ58DRAFT_843319 [Suillus subalutaceus]|uniref:uncharacterized protein n=1 Tax=Suillus subalutaceus TaxID=48586 RepID=UPI001B87607D|nr:uncharacterized protein DFJ58DRAFT_843319 [Suillus subalutaceus]KAG1847003.1 hypothetical protein DFJ58DRAFT_843319 [Suillus subalutaceus]